jgi:outer membrane lipoprotein carrier protein
MVHAKSSRLRLRTTDRVPSRSVRALGGILGLLVLLSCAPSRADTAVAAAPGEPASDAAALARVEHALAELESVRADFVQETLDAQSKTSARAVGTLALKRPGRFRWDYSEPRQVIVCDGTHLWLYDADLQQVTVRTVRDTLSQTPAMLLAGQAKVRDSFTVRAAASAGGLDWVVLTPRLRDTDFRELRLGFAGTTLRRMEFEDKLNQLTRIEFTRLERNARLPDALFVFVPPPGADVIGPGTH